VNKKELPKQSVGKVENLRGEGSRGVVVYPGDMIQFGASTRVYLLDGPNEFERGALKAKQQAQLVSSRQALPEKAETNTIHNSTTGASWGMNFDDAEHDTDESPARNNELSIDASDLPNKHRKLYESITAKKYKLSNLQTEMQRIQNKASSTELTSGQTKQLESLEKRETDLSQELSELETTLKDKLGASGSSHSPGKRGRHVDEDDVDDFYDRTSSKRAKMEDAVVETDTSLIAKCKALFLRLESEIGKAKRIQSKVDEIKQRLRTIGEADEDYFFIKNDLELATDAYNAAVRVVQSVKEEFATIEKLLKVANDKIIVEREFMFVGDAEDHKAFMRSRDEELTGFAAMPSFGMAMPPPRKMRNLKSNESLHDAMPPPTMPPPIMPQPMSAPSRELMRPPMSQFSKESDSSKRGDNSDNKSPIPPEKLIQQPRKVKGPVRPPQGTLSVLAQSGRGKQDDNKNSEKVVPKSNNADSFNSKKDEWVAPKGQDGSGITKLNAKFQGRY